MKKVIIIGLLACCVSSLFAQGSGEGKETATSQVAAGAPVTVTFWTGDRHDLDYVQKKIDEFNKTNNQNITELIKICNFYHFLNCLGSTISLN